MNVLVLGGTQFISYHIAKRLNEDGYKVATLTRGTKKGLHNKNIQEIYVDRNNITDLANALTNFDFDYVVDVSCYKLSDMKNSLLALKNKRIKKYIFMSSSAVYKESDNLPIKEDFPIGENKYWGDYGINKLESEFYLMNYHKQNNLPVAIIRPPYIYGEGNNVYREAFIFDRLKDSKPILVPDNGDTIVQFLHIEDLYLTIEKLICIMKI